jgi:PAS domain S-box-containing protein
MSEHPADEPRTPSGDDATWDFDELHPDAFRMLVEGVPAILYIDRPDDTSTNLYTSPLVEELLGFTVAEWTSDPDLWVRQLHPDDRERAVAAHVESNTKGERFLEEYRMLTQDGREVWIRDEAAPVRNDDGELLLWRGVMLDITDRKQAEEKLRWSLDILRQTIQQRRELAQRLETAQEEERRKIAADIHDDPIQVMSAVEMRLAIYQQAPEALTLEELADLQTTVREAIERLRNLLFELRPFSLDREGLVAALRTYAERASRDTGWVVQVQENLDHEPGPELRAILYRIAQEAMQNARKHAGATRLEIAVATAGEGITVRVRDDGRGFALEAAGRERPGHLGMSTMLERAELAGGWCRVQSTPGVGTTVECWLPLDAAAADPRV